MLYRVKLLVCKLLIVVFYFAPVKSNRIVFINFLGKGYGCNPKYIANEILRNNLHFDLVWLTNDMDATFPEGIRKIKYSSFKALYELATAKIIITNVKNDLRIKKKSSQYIIQTWHAPYGYKFAEAEATDKLSNNYIKESIENSKMTDLFLSNSVRQSEEYRRAFWCDCQILEKGLPRNDIYFEDPNFTIKCVKDRVGISDNAKIILYAPTFRDDGDFSVYGLDCNRILDYLGNEWVILVRLHPNVNNADVLFEYNNRIINVSNYSDIQELIVSCDMLITDYSSTMFDACLMNKPVFVFATDIDKYQITRGLKPEFFEIPYVICKDNDMLMEEIQNMTCEKAERFAKILLQSQGYKDEGKASKAVVDVITKVIGEQNG